MHFFGRFLLHSNGRYNFCSEYVEHCRRCCIYFALKDIFMHYSCVHSPLNEIPSFDNSKKKTITMADDKWNGDLRVLSCYATGEFQLEQERISFSATRPFLRRESEDYIRSRHRLVWNSTEASTEAVWTIPFMPNAIRSDTERVPKIDRDEIRTRIRITFTWERHVVRNSKAKTMNERCFH